MDISADPDKVLSAAKLILPGVGHFDQGMQNLRKRGLVEALNEAVLVRRTPILGICLGVQLFTQSSEEGRLPGLGWVAAATVQFRFDGSQGALKVPHMGWNSIQPARSDRLFAHLPADPRFYFVHSYHLVCDEERDVLAWTTHGYRFASAIQHGSIWGTQFHPEKSHKFGLAVMRDFLDLS